MNGRRLSSTQLTRLSAWLDGALNDHEAAQLKAELAHSAEMQAALVQLRQVRAMLKSLPHQKAPRHYTLNPQMVTQKAAPLRLFNTLRLSSGMAALAMLAFFIGSLIWQQPLATAALQPQKMNEALVLEAEMLAADMADSEESTPLVFGWNGSPPFAADEMASAKGFGAAGMGGSGGGGGADASQPVEYASPASTQRDEAPSYPSVDASAGSLNNATWVDLEDEALAQATGSPILGINTAQAGQMLDPSMVEQAAQPEEPHGYLQWLAAGFGILALGLAFAAFSVYYGKKRKGNQQ